MAAATDSQLDGILRRANELLGTQFRYLSQVRDVIGLSSFQLQKGITSPQASAIIRGLDRRLAEQAEEEARAAEARAAGWGTPGDVAAVAADAHKALDAIDRAAYDAADTADAGLECARALLHLLALTPHRYQPRPGSIFGEG